MRVCGLTRHLDIPARSNGHDPILGVEECSPDLRIEDVAELGNPKPPDNKGSPVWEPFFFALIPQQCEGVASGRPRSDPRSLAIAPCRLPAPSIPRKSRLPIPGDPLPRTNTATMDHRR